MTPRTAAGRALHRAEMFDLSSEEDRRRLAIAIEAEAAQQERERAYRHGYEDGQSLSVKVSAEQIAEYAAAYAGRPEWDRLAAALHAAAEGEGQ